MSIKLLTAARHHHHHHHFVQPNDDFRKKLEFFEGKMKAQSEPSPKMRVITSPPVDIGNIKKVFEAIASPAQESRPRELQTSSSRIEIQPLLEVIQVPAPEEAASSISIEPIVAVETYEVTFTLGSVTESEHVIVHSPLVQQMETLNFQLNAKDNDGLYKRAKGYYLALQDGQLIWKKPRKENQLLHEERKEAKVAFLFLLEALEKTVKSGIKEIKDKIPDSEECDPMPINRVLDKIIKKEWCKSLLIDKVILQRCISVLHTIMFRESLEPAREIHSCLLNSGKALDTIIRILSSIQLRSVALAMPNLYEKGVQNSGSFKATERIRSFQKVLEKARSPKMRVQLENEFKRRSVTYSNYMTYQTGINHLAANDRRALFTQLGMQHLFGTLAPEAQDLYLKKLFLKNQDRVSVLSSRSMIETAECLKDCQKHVVNELNLHAQWLESRDMDLRRYIHAHLTQAPKDRALAALQSGDLGVVLVEMFGQGNKVGNVVEMLSSSLEDILGRSLHHLEGHLEKTQLEAYQKRAKLLKGHIQWNEVTSLFLDLAKDMERLG